MTRTALVILAVAGVLACGRKPTSTADPAPADASASAAPSKAVIGDQTTGGGGAISQVALGGSAKPGRLPFEITGVHEKVERDAVAPWWKGTGAWTFFDAKTADGATMTFGVKEVRRLTDLNMILLDGVITTKDNVEGEHLVQALAKALGVAPPPVNAQKKSGVVPIRASVVILAEDATRGADGSFSGKGGGWDAGKWTFESAGDSEKTCEIYVNYNLASKRGEFSAKSQDNAGDCVAFPAASLRDGVALQAAPAESGKPARPKKP